MSEEIELKLELSEQAAAAFERWPMLPGPGETAQLRAIYFDTPDRQLWAHGLTLRIRQSGEERIQTVKGDDGDGGVGLFARAEWEMPVMADRPVIDVRTPIAAVLGTAAETVEPAFHVDVERRTWLLSEGSAAVEMTLDKGLVWAGDRQAPVCEVELEQKAGEPDALFSLARHINAVVPVRWGVMAKAERGYRLLEPARSAFKADALALKPSVDAGEAFRAVAQTCVRHYRLNEALLLDQYDMHAVHQARVALRRLRSALTIFKPILLKQDVALFQTELRWLAGVLGDARDLDVLMDRIEPGAPHDRLQAARATVQANVREALNSERVRSLMIDIVEWLTLGRGFVQPPDCEPAHRFAARRLQHFHKRLIKDGRAMADLDDEARHKVRKDAKKLRYAAEFFAALFAERKKQRRRYGRFMDAMEILQDDLGALNDLVNMPRILAKHGLTDEAGLTSGAGKKRKRKWVRAAAEAHHHLADVQRFWR